MIELGHIALSYRLVRGFGLLARCGDHETRAWAPASRTIYTGHEWVQRHMASGAAIDATDRSEAAQLMRQKKWSAEDFEKEFRIWDAEAKAARQVEVLAEHAARRRAHAAARIRAGDGIWRPSNFTLEKMAETMVENVAERLLARPVERPEESHWPCWSCGIILGVGLTTCRNCDPEKFEQEFARLPEKP